MNYTVQLANFCRNIRYEYLPPEVIEKAKLCLLDYVANVYGSLELEAVAGVASYVKFLSGAPVATVHGCDFKTDIQNAAFVNGTLAEAIEAQDGYRFGGSHPGVAVIPAVFAVAEEMGYSGKEVLAAIVVGYEIANRVATAGHPWQTLSGFLPTGTCGTFGAAAAVAFLKKFDENIFVSALGNAGYLLPICMAENLMGGYTIKIVQGGQAASAGIMAAGLAAWGITGTPEVLEGSVLNGGFCQITTGGQQNIAKLTDNLGNPYSIMDVYFKPYTACRHTHGSVQAVLELMQERPINIEEIEEIEVFTYGIATVAVGKGVKEKCVVSAQFSIPYVVAASLIDGELGPRQLTEKRMSDPAILELCAKVKVSLDNDLNGVYPQFTASRVEVLLKSGERRIRQVDIPRGDPRDPLDLSRLADKLIFFAGDRDRGQLDKVIDLIMRLNELDSINELSGLI